MARFENGQELAIIDAVRRLKEMIDYNFSRLQELIPDDDSDLTERQARVLSDGDQGDPLDTKYQTHTNMYYLCRYGKAYTYEYALIYDMLLRILKKDDVENVNMLSFGCGSLIDAFAMVFAATRLAEEENHAFMTQPAINYTGVDLARWDTFFVTADKINYVSNPDQRPDHLAKRFDNIELYCQEGQGYMRDNYPVGSDFDKNVIVFPKILNALRNGDNDHETALNDFLNCFRDLNFPENEYYIITSHATLPTEDNLPVPFVDELISIINRDNEFTVESNLFHMLDNEDWNAVRDAYINDANVELYDIRDRDDLRDNLNVSHFCYNFRSPDGMTYSQLTYRHYTNDVWETDDEREKSGPFYIIHNMFTYLRKLSGRAGGFGDFKTSPITRVPYFMFEIVRLKRNQEEEDTPFDDPTSELY